MAEALFDEWTDELELYQNQKMKAASSRELRETKRRYREMMSSMKRAERSMQPVLESLQDNVLYLKHNLNAQAIGALKGEFSSLKADISQLIKQMNLSIEQSNQFLDNLRKN